MKPSGAPEPGDLVIAIEDQQRGIDCVGIVVECKGINCKVMWGSKSSPIGWWKRTKIKVLSSKNVNLAK